MMILRGVTLFPYYDLGGAVENFQRKWHSAWAPGIGGPTIFFLLYMECMCYCNGSDVFVLFPDD